MNHVFEKDISNATLNPLYIQKNATTESSSTTARTTTAKLSYYWVIFRAILFLIIPIIVLWMIPYHNLYSYIWLYYVLVTQATIICNIIIENNNINKRLVVFVILSIGISIVISFIPDTMVHNKETHVLDISNNPIIDVREAVFYTYRDLTEVKMSNLQDSSFSYLNAPDNYSKKMLESYFESNTILQLFFQGKTFVSFCSISVGLNMLEVRSEQNEINLNWNCLGRFEGLKYIAFFTNKITDIDCGYLALAMKEMKGLSILRLHFNKISDIGIGYLVPALKEMKGLSRLYLDNNRMGDIGIGYLVPALKEMKGLSELVLDLNNISDIGIGYLVPALKEMKGMSKLSLDHNHISDIGIGYLVPALKEMKGMSKLSRLYLSGNKISDIGIGCLVPVLKEIKEIMKLKLHHNNINDPGIKKLGSIVKYMNGLQYLSLWGNNITSDGNNYIKQVWSDAGKPSNGLCLHHGSNPSCQS